MSVLTRTILACYLILASVEIRSQDFHWKLENQLEFDSRITAWTLDSFGAIFLGFENGATKKLTKELAITYEFQPDDKSAVKSLSLQNSLQPLVFYEGTQEFQYLDRFLANPVDYQLTDLATDYVQHLTTSEDGYIWFLTNNPIQLNKWNENVRESPITVPIQLYMEPNKINHLQAKNGLIVISDEVLGIVLMDYFGNQLAHYELQTQGSHQILDDTIVAIVDDYILQIDISTGKYTEIIPPQGQFQGVIKLSTTDWVFISDDRISEYRIN